MLVKQCLSVGLHLLDEDDDESRRLRGIKSQRRSRGIMMFLLEMSI